MRSLEDMYNVCEDIQNNGAMYASPDDINEIVEIAKIVLDNLITFNDRYVDEDLVNAALNHEYGAKETLANIFDELDYYFQEG